jgi:hypothetical protein
MNYRSPVLFEKLLIQKSRGLASPRSLTPHHPRATVPKLSARERERERERRRRRRRRRRLPRSVSKMRTLYRVLLLLLMDIGAAQGNY